ncbi:alpha/beta hydrolase family protein [candidate division KSB1 bacterium]
MLKRQFTLNVTPERIIYGDFRVPEYHDGKPLIIFCHGFKGFKDWGGWQYALDKFAINGFFVISINFSFNGIGGDLQNFTDLNKFGVNTIGKELEDIDMIMTAVEDGQLFPEISAQPKTGLIGHSRGGGTVILYAAQKKSIISVVTWAGVANFDSYLSQAQVWRDRGYLEFENKRTQQMMRMNLDFLNDLESNVADRNILRAEAGLGIPHLIIHGDRDEAVSSDHARNLLNASDKTKTRLEIIKGGTHTFGCAHPFSGSGEPFDTVIHKTAEWFRNFLS